MASLPLRAGARVAVLCALLSGPGSVLYAQDATYLTFLGGLPVTGSPEADHASRLGVPLAVVGLETPVLDVLAARLSLAYGLGHAQFRDPQPCDGCEALPVPFDVAKYSSDVGLAAMADLQVGLPVQGRIDANIFGGLGLAYAPEGPLDQQVPDGYRVETHTAPMVTYGGDVTVGFGPRIGLTAQVRGTLFIVGERQLTTGAYDDFDVDLGNVNGLSLLVGLRVKT